MLFLFPCKTTLTGEDIFYRYVFKVSKGCQGYKALVLHILSIGVKIEKLYWAAAATHYLRGQETMGRRLEKNKLHCWQETRKWSLIWLLFAGGFCEHHTLCTFSARLNGTMSALIQPKMEIFSYNNHPCLGKVKIHRWEWCAKCT